MEEEEGEEEALYGRDYLDWKRQTLGAQVSHHTSCKYDTKHDNDSESLASECCIGEEYGEYSIHLARPYTGPAKHTSTRCLGMVVDGGYMFLLDPDMSNFPLITWHCPKYRIDGCPASFVTRITNPETVRTSLPSPSTGAVARSMAACHIMDDIENIERHENHRPGHYKENISPLIYGLFSREVREALGNYLCDLLSHLSSCYSR